MTETEFKELIRILNQPHRVQNIFALFKHCEKAATLIQNQKSKIEMLETLELEKPKKATASKKVNGSRAKTA
jgi:hypothetical protein